MTRKLGIISTGQVIHLSTKFQYPPIPIRTMDWFAIDSNTYDADCDQDGYYSTSPQGMGETELEAINDLIDQLEEAHE